MGDNLQLWVLPMSLTPGFVLGCQSVYKNTTNNNINTKHLICCFFCLLQFPSSEEEWMKIADDFNKRWQFPNCIGALDGKHIVM